MRILIVTPLYPPDIAEPAPYTKELALRLCKDHDVTIATYGDLPELIEHVTIRSVSKRHPTIVRLLQFLFLLMIESRKASVVYVQNGPSVEFPLYFIRWFIRAPIFMRMTDLRAKTSVETHPFMKRIQTSVLHSAKKEIAPPLVPDPLPRPEILPLETFPQNAMDAWEVSWNAHTEALVRIFAYGK